MNVYSQILCALIHRVSTYKQFYAHSLCIQLKVHMPCITRPDILVQHWNYLHKTREAPILSSTSCYNIHHRGNCKYRLRPDRPVYREDLNPNSIWRPATTTNYNWIKGCCCCHGLDWSVPHFLLTGALNYSWTGYQHCYHATCAAACLGAHCVLY